MRNPIVYPQAERGLAEELVRLGNKGHFGSVYGGDERIVHLDFGHVESRFPYLLFVSQAETERVLRDACAGHGVTPEWGTELVGIQQEAHDHEASPVHATLKRADGSLERTAAPWMIGAEGAHSLVHSTLDLAFEGRTSAEDYALGDLKIDGALADTDFHLLLRPRLHGPVPDGRRPLPPDRLEPDERAQ